MSQRVYPSVAHPCILVVEDEFLIRMLLSDDLRAAGHQVIEACSADEAMVLIDTTLPDLIITDVRMPGSIDGMGLLDFVKQKHPSLPIIITSGHFDEYVAVAAGASGFMAKPYTSEPMLRAVQNALAHAQ